jgi:hypothetical protein
MDQSLQEAAVTQKEKELSTALQEATRELAANPDVSTPVGEQSKEKT